MADILQLAKNAIVKTTDSEIVYEPGVEMTVQLTAKTSIDPGRCPGRRSAFRPSHPRPATATGQRQPFQTMAAKPPKESDMTNLMFIGSQDELEAAFAEAGWASAAALSRNSSLETFRAVAELRGYKEAPCPRCCSKAVRPTQLPEAEQHLRPTAPFADLAPPGLPNGRARDYGSSSSTHDTGIDFSEENRTFIHKVDSNIDRERAKVVSDLIFTGKVVSVALVDRPAVPGSSMNATGDKLLTDGGMAVVVLGGR